MTEELQKAFERARAAWPELELSFEEFATGGTVDPAHAGDVFLARCCCLDRPGAIAAFESRFRGLFRSAVPPRLRARLPEDFEPELRQRLLVGDGEPLLARYDGRGALGGWLRVTIARAAISAVRKSATAQRRNETLPDLLGIMAAQRDPELDYLRNLYRDAFRTAFESAVGTLTERERSLVHLSLVRNVSVRKLGTMYGIGSSTAARWVSKAVTALSSAVRSSLAENLGATEEIDSIMRLLDGSLELSVSRILDPD